MKKRKANPISTQPMFAGIAVMLLLSAILTAAAAALILGGVLEQNVIQTAGIVCAATASFFGSMVAAKKAKTKKMIYALCTCGIYTAGLFLCNLLFAKDGELHLLQVLLPVLICAVMGCLLTASKKKKPIGRKNAGTNSFSKIGK